jgi:Inhibitor of vertebrate lysozyme (Ivy)
MRQVCWMACLFSAFCPWGYSSVLAANDVYLTDVIKNSPYALALSNLLRSSRDLPAWTKQTLKVSGDYVGDPMVNSTVDGTSYELFTTCKPHDCSDSQLEVMFAPNGAQAWAAYAETGKSIVFLGAPNAAQQAALGAALQH